MATTNPPRAALAGPVPPDAARTAAARRPAPPQPTPAGPTGPLAG